MLIAGHAVGEKGERKTRITRHNNSTARTLFGITKEEEDQKKKFKTKKKPWSGTTGADAF